MTDRLHAHIIFESETKSDVAEAQCRAATEQVIQGLGLKNVEFQKEFLTFDFGKMKWRYRCHADFTFDQPEVSFPSLAEALGIEFGEVPHEVTPRVTDTGEGMELEFGYTQKDQP